MSNYSHTTNTKPDMKYSISLVDNTRTCALRSECPNRRQHLDVSPLIFPILAFKF